MFNAVQQGWTTHRTNEMFSYDLCSINYSIVQAVQFHSTTSNTWEIIHDSFSFNSCEVQAVWLVWNTSRSWTFSYNLSSSNCSVVRTVWLDGTTLNSSTFRVAAGLPLNLQCIRRTFCNVVLTFRSAEGPFVNILCRQGTFHPLSVQPCIISQLFLWSFFPQFVSRSSSSLWLNYIELVNILLWSWFSQLFGSLCCLAGLNYPELMKRSPTILVPSFTR